jgi:phosphopentomutase
MKIYEKDSVLHIVFNEKDIGTSHMKEIVDIADIYEGRVGHRQGFNFPMKIVRPFVKNKKSVFSPYVNTAEYVISYKDGDVLTKKHELQHAKYFIDQTFSQKVKALWESFPSSYQKGVNDMLLRMGYPNETTILLDEFQAYYFTEKPFFFGKIK